MKPISELISLTQFSKYKSDNNVAEMNNEKTKKILNRLFIRLAGIFPKFWVNIKSQDHLNAIKDEWFEVFERANLSNTAQILQGIEHAQRCSQEYLPKAITFVEWCTNLDPSTLGYPDYATAYPISTLINAEFSDYAHPDKRIDLIIRHTIKQIGSYDYRRMSQSKSLEVFEHYYTIVVRDFINGKLNPVPKMLNVIANEKPIHEIIKKEYLNITTGKDCFKKLKEILR